jgi:hypothetical protein
MLFRIGFWLTIPYTIFSRWVQSGLDNDRWRILIHIYETTIQNGNRMQGINKINPICVRSG